ncbi:hypothetical protein [Alishewanella tabrizica]|uniref:Uncharacterized protein n=1 Tax=Alishewanella tabrizica TaxID=671278 RepID=A0ABQ2WJU8_9ALTE|nr:hypothetical protein [Alishewanella tabrizica]GGW57061.1 hypothetical protein GCM10008111_11380 [Alishewanella tabrizica]
MNTFALERIDNFLVLPETAPLTDYVISQAEDENCWFVHGAADNAKLLAQLAAQQAEKVKQARLSVMLQGTFEPVQRQGNLLLLPEWFCSSEVSIQFFLKLSLTNQG